MKDVIAKSHKFAPTGRYMSLDIVLLASMGILAVWTFLLSGLGGSLVSSVALLCTVISISLYSLASPTSSIQIERSALAHGDRFVVFGLGLMHFAALPIALYSFTHEGQTLFGWALHIITFGMFFGSVSFGIAHMLIHSTKRPYAALGRVIYSSLRYGSYVSAHLLVHHPRKGTHSDIERVRTGETFYRYAARVYFSGIRMGHRAENQRRKAFNYGQLDLIHPHAQYVLIALLTAFISAILFGPMGFVNIIMISTVARLQALTTTYLRNLHRSNDTP